MPLDELGALAEFSYVQIGLHEVAGGTTGYTIGARVVLVIVDAVNADAACGCWSFPAVFTWLPDERLKIFTCDVNAQITFLRILFKVGPAALLYVPIVAGHWMRWLSYEGEHTHSALTARIVLSSALAGLVSHATSPSILLSPKPYPSSQHGRMPTCIVRAYRTFFNPSSTFSKLLLSSFSCVFFFLFHMLCRPFCNYLESSFF